LIFHSSKTHRVARDPQHMLQQASRRREPKPIPLNIEIHRFRLLLWDSLRMRFTFAGSVPNASRLPMRRGKFFWKGNTVCLGQESKTARGAQRTRKVERISAGRQCFVGRIPKIGHSAKMLW